MTVPVIGLSTESDRSIFTLFTNPQNSSRNNWYYWCCFSASRRTTHVTRGHYCDLSCCYWKANKIGKTKTPLKFEHTHIYCFRKYSDFVDKNFQN